jgi:hypothetical protein
MVTIVAAAVRRNRLVFSMEAPARHHHILNTMSIQEEIDALAVEQGFLTSEGRYVDRVEGLAIATLAGQIIRRSGGENAKELFSEDLW